MRFISHDLPTRLALATANTSVLLSNIQCRAAGCQLVSGGDGSLKCAMKPSVLAWPYELQHTQGL